MLTSMNNNFNNNYKKTDELWQAFEDDDLGYLQFSINYCGLDINTKTGYEGNTLLIHAAYYGSIKCLNFLLKEGADVNLKNHFGNTALPMATYRGHSDCILPLVQFGANVNEENFKGYTPLIFAVISGRKETAETLLLHGADPEYKSKHGKTALSETNDKNMIDIIVSAILKKKFAEKSEKERQEKKANQVQNRKNLRSYIKKIRGR